MPRKMKWKNTPEGKAHYKRLSEMSKQRAAARAAIKQEGTPDNAQDSRRNTDPTIEQTLYGLGRIQGWIQAYSESIGCSPASLAERISDLLHTNALRHQGRAEDTVRSVRGERATRA